MVAPVRFEVSCEDAYDYLVAPANRSEWQSSLRGVDDVVGIDGVAGQSWVDVTMAGIRPLMELTDADRPHRWSERGTWRGFRATLTLTFTPVGSFCDVGVSMHVAAAGLARPLGFAANRVAPSTVRSDLRRAAKILARR
ncbi:SRPBCC family protein [Nocardioides sp.]|uniref:SRPBCC family protein n=1 Tax=Nocardioides sp. TaxID=35761 RepID=UPI00271EC3AF|nr:SRPBCC family protein [Nocardioides sp.]MDO9457237.1 SRPBCC family protein [Nocardioides sp.]